jgi:chromosome segregation ATPase
MAAVKFDAAAPVQESAPAQSLKEAQGSEVKETKRVLSKMEEKFYRKTVEKLLNEAEAVENPLARLNECMDILDCFDEGLLPDLKESLEKKLVEQKEKLESLVEKVAKTEKDFGMDLDTFREATERTVSQGLLFKDQVTDYKALCEGLQDRNKKLVEEIESLSEKLKISEKLTEKKILNANKEIVSTSTELDNLNESLEKATSEIVSLKNTVKKLSEGNKHFEKENGLLDTKLKEAVEIIQNSKSKRLQESQLNKNAFEQVKLLE